MLETSFGLSFFLKPSTNESNSRYLYLRVTVDGVRKSFRPKENGILSVSLPALVLLGKLSIKNIFVLTWTGLRGGISIEMALSLLILLIKKASYLNVTSLSYFLHSGRDYPSTSLFQSWIRGDRNRIHNN